MKTGQARDPISGAQTPAWPAAGGGPNGLPSASQHAALVGRKVLAGLDRGRQIAIQQAQARAAEKRIMIVIAANADRAAGKPERGLTERISRKLPGFLSQRQIKRILATLSSLSDSAN